MEHDYLFDLGLDDDGAIARIAQHADFLDAWNQSTEPSDMIWIAARTCLQNAHVQILGLISMTLGPNITREEDQNLINIQRKTLWALKDPQQNIVENLVVAMNAALIEGEKIGLKIVGEDDDNQIVFDARHHAHMFVWQSIRSLTNLYVEEFEDGAEQMRFGWTLLPQSIKENAVKFLRNGIDYSDWFADWLKENAVGEA